MANNSFLLPSTLNELYNGSSSLRQQYEFMRLDSADVFSILRLPLARRIFGHDDNALDPDSLEDLLAERISFTAFVAKRAQLVVREKSDELPSSCKCSQLLHIALAALFGFLQSNVTGPPLDFAPGDLVLPAAFSSTRASSTADRLRSNIIRDLSVDGESAYKLTPNVELFAVAKALMAATDMLVKSPNAPLMARTAHMRVNFLHQKMLSDLTGTLQDEIYADLDKLFQSVMHAAECSTEEKSRFLLERATVHIHHGFDGKARADLQLAASMRGFEFALTGKLGKRTKYQDRDISQLVVLAKSHSEKKASDTLSRHSSLQTANSLISEERGQPSQPRNLDLNDDTLLDAISFANENALAQLDETIVTVRDKSSLPPSLSTINPGDQPILDPVDSAILLALVSAITNTSPENGLTREETLPYATRVLDGGSSNWQIYTQALLVRSRVEGYRARTIERSVLQMQALVDQVVADTDTTETAAAVSNTDFNTTIKPTTFLPRPKKSESAPAAQRLEYIWLLSFSTRWSLEAELASRWVNLGGLRTALEIYERLQMWAEVALCYAATDREEKAKLIIRRQLYEPTSSCIRSKSSDKNNNNNNGAEDEDGASEKFDGPELSPLPTDAPRLFCILGDIDKDAAMYERAWVVSNCRYARAQHSLARHYLAMKPPALERAEAAYRKSLSINRLNHGAWFSLGCVQLELQQWQEAIESFTRTVQLEDTDAEAWSNLAAAMLRFSDDIDDDTENLGVSASDHMTSNNYEDELMQQPVKNKDPYKRKRDALAALNRAAQLKQTDYRIWENLLTVAASIPPPVTPFRDIILAQRRVIEILGPKKGEKCIDISILGMLVDHIVQNYRYEDLLVQLPVSAQSAAPAGATQDQDKQQDGLSSSPSPSEGPTPHSAHMVLRSGTIPGQIFSLVDDLIVPLITHSSPLWLLVARLEQFRDRPDKALEAHEKAWRAMVASSAQAAFQMGDEKKWMDVVRATERLVRDGYARFGPMEMPMRGDSSRQTREEGGIMGGGVEGGEETRALVSSDWRFKARSAVRGILGKGKEFWEDSEGWARLKELQVDIGGGSV